MDEQTSLTISDTLLSAQPFPRELDMPQRLDPWAASKSIRYEKNRATILPEPDDIAPSQGRGLARRRSSTRGPLDARFSMALPRYFRRIPRPTMSSIPTAPSHSIRDFLLTLA